MKRSEMIKRIEYFFNLPSIKYSKNKKQTYLALLDSLELQGMLPPEREVVTVPKEGEIRKLSYIDYNNTWEPEDDK